MCTQYSRASANEASQLPLPSLGQRREGAEGAGGASPAAPQDTTGSSAQKDDPFCSGGRTHRGRYDSQIGDTRSKGALGENAGDRACQLQLGLSSFWGNVAEWHKTPAREFSPRRLLYRWAKSILVFHLFIHILPPPGHQGMGGTSTSSTEPSHPTSSLRARRHPLQHQTPCSLPAPMQGQGRGSSQSQSQNQSQRQSHVPQGTLRGGCGKDLQPARRFSPALLGFHWSLAVVQSL